MSAGFLDAAAVRAMDVATRPPPPAPLRLPRRMSSSINEARSCSVRSAKAIKRFLSTPHRRSCSFVNPSEDLLREINQTALEQALLLTQNSETNVGAVVRLTRSISREGRRSRFLEHEEMSCLSPSPRSAASPDACGVLSSSPPTGAPDDDVYCEATSPATGAPDEALSEATGAQAVAFDASASGGQYPWHRMVSFRTQPVVSQVRRVLSDSSERPELTKDGTGGVYMIRESSRSSASSVVSDDTNGGLPVAVFKPSDEEAGSDNNPRGLTGADHVMREGFHTGGGAMRERVAYKLDQCVDFPNGFAGVPRTAVDSLLLRSNSGKLRVQYGSIQEFVESDGDASDFRFDGSEFDEGQSMRLMLQDCRLFNCDRHEGNILVRRPRRRHVHSVPEGCSEDEADGAAAAEAVDAPPRPPLKLAIVPIDHAFCLPNFGYYREAEFAWRYWVSAQRPFGGEVRAYVASLDVEADVEVARRAGLSESSAATLRVCTMLCRQLLVGSVGREEVTPKDLAALLMREEFDVPSPLETMCARALGLSKEESAKDTGLIDWVAAAGQPGHTPAEFVPPPEFYVRFAALLEQAWPSRC